MKTLFYTISTPDKAATQCSMMLYSSLASSLGNIDFKVAVPEAAVSSYPSSFKNLIISSVKPNASWSYVGDLKYTPSVYNLNYDNFVYLDSDILWFIKNFDASLNQFATERKPITDAWFSTGWSPKNVNRKGVCAGFFCVSKALGLEMSKFVSDRLAIWGEAKAPEREQSTFNQFLESCGYDKWKNVSKLVVAGARPKTKFRKEKMFHFQGLSGPMDVKYESMNEFLRNNELILPPK